MNAAVDTRERILGSARELIYARNYADVGVAQICQAAGVQKGSFYHFFPSKRDLTLAVLDSVFADIKHGLLDRGFDPALDPLQRLRRFVELIIEFQRDFHAETGFIPGCQFGNLAAEQSTQDDVLRARLEQLFGRMRAVIRDTLDDAVRVGQVASMDTDATAAAMLAYFEGVLLLAKTHNDPVLMARLMPAMLNIRVEEAGA